MKAFYRDVFFFVAADAMQSDIAYSQSFFGLFSMTVVYTVGLYLFAEAYI